MFLWLLESLFLWEGEVGEEFQRDKGPNFLFKAPFHFKCLSSKNQVVEVVRKLEKKI